jgi:LacI family transcriptional regulator
VVGDDFNGGYQATDYLLKLGHTRIGIVAGPRHASTAYDRLQGYRKALADHGMPIDEALVVHTEFEAEGGVVGTHAMLSLADPPTAIFAVNDTAAIGAMGAASQRGLNIQRDLSIVGYNDIPIVAQLPIPLTTIHSDLNNMGATAVQSLLAAIDTGQTQNIVLPVSLVVRSSAAARG